MPRLDFSNVRTNAEAPASVLEDVAQPDAQGLKLLREAAESMRLSARGYHRVLRVARTLADLDGADKIGRLHLAEALSYRALADDMKRAASSRRPPLHPHRSSISRGTAALIIDLHEILGRSQFGTRPRSSSAHTARRSASSQLL